MKANQKFRSEDHAVSPVIAVILMVAITVVLAATVYVWVSGFGGSSGQAAKTISLAQNKEGSVIAYTVTGATTGLRWSDLKFSVAGVSTDFQIVLSDGDVSTHGTGTTFQPTSTGTVDAGDRIYLVNGATSDLSAVEFTVLDLQANSIMTKIIGGRADAGAATDPASTTLQRISGTAGTFTAGVTRITFDRPIDMATLVVADLAPATNSMGASTITVRSPTAFDINWASDASVVSTEVITIAAGAIDDQTSTATAGAVTITLAASS